MDSRVYIDFHVLQTVPPSCVNRDDTGSPKTAVYGGTTRAVLDAVDELRDMGYAVGMFRPVTLWPFPEHELVERAKQLRRLLVVEHNYGQVLLTVEGIIKGDTSVEFVGKVNGTAISPKEIIRKVEEGEE